MELLLERARRVLPQDWPFGSAWAVRHDHGLYPQFAERAQAARFWDVAGAEYLDWYLGGGVVTLGHRHPDVQRAILEQLERGVHVSLPTRLEVEVAERLCALFPGVEQVAFGKNGTDVTTAAVRLARHVTGREHVLISGYHGCGDWSKAASEDCRGIPAALRGLVHEFGYNDLDRARALMARHGRDVAAIVVEPLRYAALSVPFLQGLRQLADEWRCLLVFDEVVTGLRVARGGVQQLSGVRADLTCLAKSLANGLPLAALAGPRRFMKHLPPTFFGLTYQREALSLAAARAVLDLFKEHEVSAHLAALGEKLRAGFAAAAAAAGLSWSLDGHPSMLHMRLGGGGRLTTRGAEALFVEACQRRGVYVQLHRILPSFAHTQQDVDQTLAVFTAAMQDVLQAMDDGLEAQLDGPIWSEFQQPGRGAPPKTLWSREQAACVFERVPPDVRAGGMQLGFAPSSAPAGAEARADRVVLRVDRCGRGETVRARARLVRPIGPEFRACVRWRLATWDPGNAVVTIRLSGSGESDGEWSTAEHASSFGQAAWSCASLAGRYHRIPCPYGMREGTLTLEHAGGVTSAWHETEQRERIGSERTRSQRTQIALELAVSGVSGPVVVDLLELSITPGAVGTR
jgi:glutamate-1-semialdehyde 2,1-aminomutase